MVLRRFVVALMLILPMVVVRRASAQAGDDVAGKTITFRAAFLKNAPLQVVSLAIHGKAVPLDTPVPLESSWLDDVALTVTNTSPKTLTYVSGSVVLPALTLVNLKYALRQGSSGVLGFQIGAGVPSEFLLHRKDGRRAPPPQVPSIAIAPGETVMLHVLGTIASDSAKVSAVLPASSEARFVLSTLWYSDDTCFFNGTYQKVADFDQRKLEPISLAEFQR